jgi:hypothetical protein
MINYSPALPPFSAPAFGVCGGWTGASGIGTSEKSSCDTALMVITSISVSNTISPSSCLYVNSRVEIDMDVQTPMVKAKIAPPVIMFLMR